MMKFTNTNLVNEIVNQNVSYIIKKSERIAAQFRIISTRRKQAT